MAVRLSAFACGRRSRDRLVCVVVAALAALAWAASRDRAWMATATLGLAAFGLAARILTEAGFATSALLGAHRAAVKLMATTGGSLDFHLIAACCSRRVHSGRTSSALALLNLLATPLALLTPVPLKIAVDSIAGSAPFPGSIGRWLPVGGARLASGRAGAHGGLMVAVEVVSALQAFAAWLLETYTGERLVLAFRAKLFRHVQRLSLSYHDTRGTADSMYRIQYDAPAIQSIATNGVMPFVSSTIDAAR